MGKYVKYKMIGIVITIAFVFLQISCVRIPLSKAHQLINPYTGNDVLIFKSNKTHKTDTLYLYKIRKVYYDGPELIFIKHQSLIAYAFATNFYGQGKHLNTQNIFYFDPKGITYFSIALNKDVSFYCKMNTVDYLNRSKFQTIEIDGKTYTDVIELEDRLLMDNRPDIAPRAYWSKSQGFIRIEKLMGEQFDLISKYQDTATCEAIRLKEKEPIGDKQITPKK